MRQFCAKNADEIERFPALAPFAAELRQETGEGDSHGRLEDFERRMIEAAKGLLTDEQRAAIAKELKRQQDPYGGKLTAEQLAMLKGQFEVRRTLEILGLPRPSLFYCNVETPK